MHRGGRDFGWSNGLRHGPRLRKRAEAPKHSSAKKHSAAGSANSRHRDGKGLLPVVRQSLGLQVLGKNERN